VKGRRISLPHRLFTRLNFSDATVKQLLYKGKKEPPCNAQAAMQNPFTQPPKSNSGIHKSFQKLQVGSSLLTKTFSRAKEAKAPPCAPET